MLARACLRAPFARVAARGARWCGTATGDAAAGASLSAGFGAMPLVRSATRRAEGVRGWTEIADLRRAGTECVGRTVLVRARVSTSRPAGKRLLFVVLRQGAETVQAVLNVKAEGGVTNDDLKWCAGVSPESIVDVTGEIAGVKTPITGCSVSGVELKISGMRVVSESAPVLPFQLADAAARSDGDDVINVQQSTRLDNRWLDMRTPANQAIWRLQSAVCQLFRGFLLDHEFVEIHTPKLIPTASESGATVFKLDYLHGKSACLAQSPQLYKQMALQGDLRRVFEIGPVFRAEDSNTHRHLCEFTGLDIEMEVKEHYYEVLDVAEGVLGHIFHGLRTHEKFAPLVAAVKEQWPSTEFVHYIDAARLDALQIAVLEEGGTPGTSGDEYAAVVASRAHPSLRLSFKNGVRMLRELGRVELPDDDDLTTEAERVLGRLVKERYGVDFFILDTYPLSVRPFYTMPHPDVPGASNSYDMFMRGEEISSGAQRVHDAAILRARCAEKGLDTEQLKDYISSFTLGGWPHGGFGIGMERVLMLYLGLPNVRATSLFPRTPTRNTP